MKKLLIPGVLIVAIIASAIYYINSKNNYKDQVSEETQSIVDQTESLNVQEVEQQFTFQTPGSVTMDFTNVTTNKVTFTDNSYLIRRINDNQISIEKNGVQLVVVNAGIEAFNVYFLKSNRFVDIGTNNFFLNPILRYEDSGELNEGQPIEPLKYTNRYFYLDAVAKQSSQCEGEFGCSGAALTPENYNIYVYCSVEDISDINKCDELLFNLKFTVTNTKDNK